MISMQLSDAANAIEGELLGGDGSFLGVSTDTRTLGGRELFFALRGPRFDAHDKLSEAVAAGAAGVVIERPARIELARIMTSDARRGLGRLAREWRGRFEIPVLAVTGSVGKTTVKEMLSSVMREQGRVLATRGNLNNDIGVPLTVFGLDSDHDAFVVEMGANRAGDIAWLCEIARPRIGVITRCAPSHLEGFGTVENVARAKGEIISALDEDGIAVINNEDRFAPLWRELAGTRKVIAFGRGGSVDATAVKSGPDGARFRLETDVGDVGIALRYRGRHNVSNALAAAAAARAAGVPLEAIRAGLERAEPVPGRLQVRTGPAGLRVIDDSYNANPESLRAALTVLAEERGHKWLVLGDMAELGDDREKYHREAGAAAAAAGVERLFTTGALARIAADAFTGSSQHCSELGTLADAVKEALQDSRGDDIALLIKGSRVMQLDRLSEVLLAEEEPPC